MNWFAIVSLVYIAVLIAVILRIVYETHNSNKALAYIFFCIFVPVLGIVFYILFGINYFNKKRYAKKIQGNAELMKVLNENIKHYDKASIKRESLAVAQNSELAHLLLKDLGSPLSGNNKVEILRNGERKFPVILEAMNAAKSHIHLEYYIYELDETGQSLIDMMIKKAKQGIEVKFIYDDFGSPGITGELEKRMTEAGVEIYPFQKIRYYLMANRFNYRNHRKILIIDGHTSFVGGINVSDKYVNTEDVSSTKLYWRDTHIKIEGPGTYYLQYLFISDWNFCGKHNMQPEDKHFGDYRELPESCYVQIAAGGPDSPLPTILYSLMQAVNLAKEEILITTPYFIPGDSMLDSLCMAAMSGVKVKLLVPGVSDSKIVDAASKSYYSKLLMAGAEVYLYKKGFVHAKTIVADKRLSIIGTANMDIRSFELNFEVNAVVYNDKIGTEMADIFYDDVKYAEKIDKEQWLNRKWTQQIGEKFARLLSPVL